MDINKYNLFINESFDKYKFGADPATGIFVVAQKNMTDDMVYLVLNTKPENNTDFSLIALDAVTEMYLFPTSTTNVSFGIGELLQTVDGNALFVITNYVSGNRFGLKLVQCANGTDYELYNNTQTILYNEKVEQKWFDLNENKSKVIDQQQNYTEILNNGSKLGAFVASKASIATDYTSDYTVAFDFSLDDAYATIYNLVDKFYLNLWVYNYNDFKYIYRRDLIETVNDNNYSLSGGNLVMGVLKTANTKILPHKVFRLQKGQSYNFTDTKINKYTSFESDYSGDKILLVMQLSLGDKSVVYDLNNTIESDSIFIIT